VSARIHLWMRVMGLTVLALGGAAGYAEGQGSAASGSQAAAFTIDGDAALWTVAVRPDKTQDFERVMAKLREGLHKSQKPERQRQAAGWRLLKIDKPMPDGNIAYVHIIQPVVENQKKRSVGPRSWWSASIFTCSSRIPPWPWTMGLGSPVVPDE